MTWFHPYWGGLPLDLSNLKPKDLNKFRNRIEFQNLFEYFFNLALNRYEWEGLPDTCDERFLERSFVLAGRALIAKDDGGYLSLAAAPGFDLTLYGYPARAYGWGMNGFNKEYRLFVPGADEMSSIAKAASGYDAYPTPEAVMGYDNIDMYPPVRYILSAVERMADLMRAMDVVCQNLKTPFIISCEESQKSSVMAALQARNDNIATIISSRLNMSGEMLRLWPTNQNPEILSKFWEHFLNIESRLLDFLGINNNQQSDKRERLIVDEVNANNDLISRNLENGLKMREKFCKDLEAIGLTGVTVKIKERSETYDGASDILGMAGGAPGRGPIRGDDV